MHPGRKAKSSVAKWEPICPVSIPNLIYDYFVIIFGRFSYSYVDVYIHRISVLGNFCVANNANFGLVYHTSERTFNGLTNTGRMGDAFFGMDTGVTPETVSNANVLIIAQTGANLLQAT